MTVVRLSQLDPYVSLQDPQTYPNTPLPTLIKLKTEIETKLDSLGSKLQNELNSNMTESLLSGDGFPKPEAAEIRFTRVAILKYRNDLEALREVIAEKLGDYFKGGDDTASPQVIGSSDGDGISSSTSSEVGKMKENRIPFAKIESILPDSPAHLSGLEMNDLIIEFGCITVLDHDELRAIGSVVKRGEQLRLKVKRSNNDGNSDVLEKFIVPDLWNGPGLLGMTLNKI